MSVATQTHTERSRDVLRKRVSRSAERDIGKVPKVKSKSRRTRLERDPRKWLRYYLHEQFVEPFTEDQENIIDEALEVMKHGGYKAIAAPRGDGKSTILRGLLIYALFAGLIAFPVGIGKSKSAAIETILDSIKRECEDNERLQADYPEVCHPIICLDRSPRRAAQQTYTNAKGDEKFTGLEWSGDGVVFAKIDGSRAAGSILKIRGADSAIRGLNVGGKRPDFVLIDDPDDDESARSELQAEKRRAYIKQGVMALGTARRPVGCIMLCTIPAAGSVSDIFTDPEQEPAWRGRRISMLKKRPDRVDLWEQYVDLRRAGLNPQNEVSPDAAVAFYKDHREEMDAGAEVSNPYAFNPATQLSTLQACYDIVADRGEEAFETEYQNNPPKSAEDTDEVLTAYQVSRRLSGADEFVVPVSTRALTVFVDLGKYRLHWSAVASMPDASAQVVGYGWWAVPGANQVGTERAILGALRDLEDYLVSRPWRRPSGEVAKIDLFGVDAGNWNTVAYQFVRESDQPWRAVMGLNIYKPKTRRTATERPGFEYWESRQERRLWVVNQNTIYFKRRVHEGFAANPGEPGSLTVFGDDDRVHRDSERDKYASQIVAERWVEGETTRDGKPKAPHMKRFGANHYLDTTGGALCLAAVLGVRPVGASKPAGGGKPVDLSAVMGGKKKKRGGRR